MLTHLLCWEQKDFTWLYSTQAPQYTNQMLGSCPTEKGLSVLAVTNGVSLIYMSVWSNIYRKHRLTETRTALTQLELPAVAASQAQSCLVQAHGVGLFVLVGFCLTKKKKEGGGLLAHFCAVAA